MNPTITSRDEKFGKVMISYAWDSESPVHHAWVEKLYTRLEAAGLSVTLDKFSVPLVGRSDLYLWIEKAVRNADWIVAIVTEKYVKKCDNRDAGHNGLGYEIGQIVAKFIRGGLNDRIICLLRHHAPGVESVPPFLPNAFYFDFTDESKFDENFTKLIDILGPAKNESTINFGKTAPATIDGSNAGDQPLPQNLALIDTYRWKANQESSIFSCVDRPSLQIKLIRERGWKISDVWAVRSLGCHAYRVRVVLMVNEKEHESFNFAATDGIEQYLPCPKLSNQQLNVTWLADIIGAILNKNQPYTNLKNSAQICVL